MRLKLTQDVARFGKKVSNSQRIDSKCKIVIPTCYVNAI
jgi:hypothetical protein